MKIALYGNVCNNMYAIAKALRAYSRHDAHLYLPARTDFNNLPENDEPELRDNYPFWIHKGRIYDLDSPLYFWKDNIIKTLNKYDLVILSSLSVGLAPYLKKCKVFFFATGGDLTVLPFKEIHRTLLYSGRRNNLKPMIYEWMQRKGIARTDKIITQPFFPFVHAIRKLKIPASRIAESYFPIIIDTKRFVFRPDGYRDLNKDIQEQLCKYPFKIFHPSRVIINAHPHLIETGQCKKNDLLVRSFAEFIGRNGIRDAGLYLVEFNQGRDKGIVELKKLIEKLGIAEYVIWLKPGNSKGFTRNDLVNIYSCCDMVADDFGAGWFGSICVEGFSCSKPVLSYVDEDAMRKIYRWHPFLSSNTIEGNVSFIRQCYSDKGFSKKQGEMGRRWALEYHSPENAGKLYVKEFEKLVAMV